MTPEQFILALSDAYENNVNISRAKNADYAGAVGDAFANFRQIEILTGGKVTTEMGIITRMSDKLIRVSNILAAGKAEVKDESICDTLSDLANYAMILRIYIANKNSTLMDQLIAKISAKQPSLMQAPQPAFVTPNTKRGIIENNNDNF